MSDPKIQDYKNKIDLTAVISSDLGPPTFRGGRLFWPCPFHEERTPGNAFGVTLDGDTYHCFGCGASGNLITWLQEHRHIKGWRDTFAELKRLAGELPSTSLTSPTLSRRSPDTRDQAPPPAWQQRGNEFVSYAEDCLWSAQGTAALNYLQDQRGLNQQTIRHFRLGFNPACIYDKPAEKWGLQHVDCVYLSRGIVIPCFDSTTLWYVQIRRPTGNDSLHIYLQGAGPKWRPDAKYMSIRGGRLALYGCNDLKADGRPMLLTEGEFDAMVAWQEIGALANVATFGGAGKVGRVIPDRWLLRLLPFHTILTVFDVDEAGKQGSTKLASMSERIFSLRTPQGHDLNDFYLRGGDLKTWLTFQCDLLRQQGIEI